MPRSSGLGTIAPLGGTSRPKLVLPETKPLPPVGSRQGVDFRRPTVFPTGPAILGLGKERVHTGGPGNPPAGFVTATTSGVEWYWYWASAVYLKSPPDPRIGPFVGDGVLWEFQVADDPLNPRVLGSYVSDFVYYLGTGALTVRIDTYFYHIDTDSEQHARDQYQKLHGSTDDVIVISAYDASFINDPTGRAAVAAVADALHGREPISPIRGGTAQVVRDQIATVEPEP